MTSEEKAEQRRKDRRIGNSPVIERQSDRERRETSPPMDRPKWNILERQADANEIAELKRTIIELEKNNMEQERSLALTQYGETEDVAVVRERAALAPYAAKLDDRGRAAVAQICYILDWNPFFDMHAWEQGGKLCMMPDYKKLLSMAKEQQRINHDSRPMTGKERDENGLSDTQVGFVTVIKEIDTFLEFARAGMADHYSPIIGYGIWSPKDSVPATWTKEMVARKRSLRNALNQLTSYKIVTKRFQEALMQIGAVSVSETDDGFAVDLPEQITEGGEEKAHFWGFAEQRQRFWIATGELGKSKAEKAAALGFRIEGDPNDSASWVNHMIKFPDLENAVAYVDVVAENLRQQIEEEAAPEVVPDDTEPVIIDSITGEVLSAGDNDKPNTCQNCKEPATGEKPYPNLCAGCAKKSADFHAAKNES